MKIDEYKAIRESGQEVLDMIFKYAAENNKQAIISSAKLLGFRDGKRMVFASENDSETLMDFMVFEKSTQNDAAYQRFYRSCPTLDELQQVNMNGILHFYFSVFEVKSIDRMGNTIVLEDLMDAGREYQLIDIGMFKTVPAGFIIFTRLIPIGDVNMTSGVSFGFNKIDRDKLLSAISLSEFKHRRKLTKTELYILIHEKNRQYGVETRTE